MAPRSWVSLGLSVVGLAASGCGEPMIAKVVMPGSKPVVEVSEADAAESLGEQGARGQVQPPTVASTTLLPAEPTKEGETKTATGNLQYTTLRPGDGPAAKFGQTVTVHYVGTLVNGTKFDSSRDRGRPYTFTIGKQEVISGWEVGITGMRVGELRRLTVPPALAYGREGRAPAIPPDSTLLFEVELLDAK